MDCVTFLQDNRTQFTYEELVRRRADREAQASIAAIRATTAPPRTGSTWAPLPRPPTGRCSGTSPTSWPWPGICPACPQRRRNRSAGGWPALRTPALERLPFQPGLGPAPGGGQLTEEERAQCKTKHTDQRRHICLVDWDELDALPQSKPGILKFYDYEKRGAAVGATGIISEQSTPGEFSRRGPRPCETAQAPGGAWAVICVRYEIRPCCAC